MSFNSDSDNSLEDTDTQDADFCPWMEPLLMNVTTNTFFAKPMAAGNQSIPQSQTTTQRSVRVLAHPRTKEGNIKKSCNFVYSPGLLFNRRIIYE